MSTKVESCACEQKLQTGLFLVKVTEFQIFHCANLAVNSQFTLQPRLTNGIYPGMCPFKIEPQHTCTTCTSFHSVASFSFHGTLYLFVRLSSAP